MDDEAFHKAVRILLEKNAKNAARMLFAKAETKFTFDSYARALEFYSACIRSSQKSILTIDSAMRRFSFEEIKPDTTPSANLGISYDGVLSETGAASITSHIIHYASLSTSSNVKAVASLMARLRQHGRSEQDKGKRMKIRGVFQVLDNQWEPTIAAVHLAQGAPFSIGDGQEKFEVELQLDVFNIGKNGSSAYNYLTDALSEALPDMPELPKFNYFKKLLSPEPSEIEMQDQQARTAKRALAYQSKEEAILITREQLLAFLHEQIQPYTQSEGELAGVPAALEKTLTAVSALVYKSYMDELYYNHLYHTREHATLFNAYMAAYQRLIGMSASTHANDETYAMRLVLAALESRPRGVLLAPNLHEKNNGNKNILSDLLMKVVRAFAGVYNTIAITGGGTPKISAAMREELKNLPGIQYLNPLSQLASHTLKFFVSSKKMVAISGVVGGFWFGGVMVTALLLASGVGTPFGLLLLGTLFSSELVAGAALALAAIIVGGVGAALASNVIHKRFKTNLIEAAAAGTDKKMLSTHAVVSPRLPKGGVRKKIEMYDLSNSPRFRPLVVVEKARPVVKRALDKPERRGFVRI